jgi:hypothetical protein
MYYYLTSVKPLPALPDKKEGVIKGDHRGEILMPTLVLISIFFHVR